MAGELREDGSLSWMDFAKLSLGEQDRAMISDWESYDEDDPAPVEPSPPPPGASTEWRVRVGQVDVEVAGFDFEDRSAEPHAALTASAQVGVRDFDTAPGARFEFEVDARVGEEGRADLGGGMVWLPSIEIDTELTVAALPLTIGQPYVARFTNAELRDGAASVAGTARVVLADGEPEILFDGNAGVSELVVHEEAGELLAGWDELSVEKIHAEGGLGDLSLTVGSVELNAPRARFVLTEDGSTNVGRALRIEPATPGDPAAAPAAAAETAGGEPPIAVEIGEVRLAGAEVEIEHRGLIEPWKGRIHETSAEAKGVGTGPGNLSLSFDGKLGQSGSFRGEGEIDPFDPERHLDVEVELTDLWLPGVSAFAQEFIGHRVDEGVLDTTLRIQVREKQLEGRDELVVEGLRLGEKVESPKALNLPFGLAVAMLKDKQGRITFEIPLSGDMSEPGFSLGPVVRQATTKVIGNMVRSPFKMLGALVGGDGEELASVAFAAGSHELPPTAQAKLEKLVEALAERPELVLGVRGAWSPALDGEVLRTAAVDREVGQRLGEAGEGAQPIDVLRVLAPERLTPEALGALGSEPADEDLRAALAEVTEVQAAEYEALADARAGAIRERLAAMGGVDASRLSLLEAAEAGEGRADRRVACELEIGAR